MITTRRTVRRGLTLIEVVVATVTLVLASAAVFGGVTFIASMAARDRSRLGALEVAHRVILQHMEDATVLAGQPLRSEMSGSYYCYVMEEMLIKAEEPGRQAAPGTPVTYTAVPLHEAEGTDRIGKPLNLLTVRVYADDDATGPANKPVLAELSRVYNWLSQDGDTLLDKLKQRFGRELDNAGLANPTGAAPNQGGGRK